MHPLWGVSSQASLCGSATAVEVKADVEGGSIALTWVGMGCEKPGALRGSHGRAVGGPWAQTQGQKAAGPAFSLLFRSPMSLPSTSTPPTPFAQVSAKPTCTCPGRREGQSIGFVFFSHPLPLMLAHNDREELEVGVRWSWTLSWLCDLGEITAPLWAFASLPAPGCVIPA